MSHARCTCKFNLKPRYASGVVRFCDECGGTLPEKPTPKVRVGHSQLYERGHGGLPTEPKLRVSYHPSNGWSVSTTPGKWKFHEPTQNSGEFLTTLLTLMPMPIDDVLSARRLALSLMAEAIGNASGREESERLYAARHHVGIPVVGDHTMEDA